MKKALLIVVMLLGLAPTAYAQRDVAFAPALTISNPNAASSAVGVSANVAVMWRTFVLSQHHGWGATATASVMQTFDGRTELALLGGPQYAQGDTEGQAFLQGLAGVRMTGGHRYVTAGASAGFDVGRWRVLQASLFITPHDSIGRYRVVVGTGFFWARLLK